MVDVNTPPPGAAEVTELLQALIRNQCVNDGHMASGNEVRSADLHLAVAEWMGIEHENPR